MNFEAVIGLELHIEMKTNSKMFSSSKNQFGAEPNTLVSPFDMAFPGSMPSVNKQAVINAIRVCHALHMDIDDELWFDRKNYFYSDLPKGYQITQQARPIGKNGYLMLNDKKIRIERLHLEEDTCKQVHTNKLTLLDYNRAGVPLVEIVSLPEISSGEEAMRYVERIRSIVSFLEVSDGKMENGSLRCDVNVSIRPIGSKKFGTKVEIKNLNTLANIKRAVDYEIKRQEALLLSGGIVKQETRRFDESKRVTVLMRNKIDEVDYKCFTEPNILPIKLDKEFIEEAIKTSPELAEIKYRRYLKLGLSEYDAKLLVANKNISIYFDNVINNGANYKLAANWILVDIQSVLNKKSIGIEQFTVSPSRLASLIKLVESGAITNKQARELFQEMQNNDAEPLDLVKKSKLEIYNDEGCILQIVNEIINNNPSFKEDYFNGKDRIVGFIIGQVMKKTNGKADPKLTNSIVIKCLKER